MHETLCTPKIPRFSSSRPDTSLTFKPPALGPYPMKGCWSPFRAESTAAMGPQQRLTNHHIPQHHPTLRGQGPSHCGRSSSPGAPEDTHPHRVLIPPAPLAAFFKQLPLRRVGFWSCLPEAKQTRNFGAKLRLSRSIRAVNREIYDPVLSRLGLTNHCTGSRCLLFNINENKNNNRFSGHHPEAEARFGFPSVRRRGPGVRSRAGQG